MRPGIGREVEARGARRRARRRTGADDVRRARRGPAHPPKPLRWPHVASFGVAADRGLISVHQHGRLEDDAEAARLGTGRRRQGHGGEQSQHDPSYPSLSPAGQQGGV